MAPAASSDASRSPPASTGTAAPHPNDAPAYGVPALSPSLLQHYGDLFPPPPESLQKVLDPPAHAAEDLLRQTFAERRALYASRTGDQFPKPVRQQNQTLLRRLEELTPTLEAHIVAIRAWRLLAEAAAAIEAHHPGRARRRLDEASALLEGRPTDQPLVVWLQDLESDLSQPPPPAPPTAPEPLLIVPPEIVAVVGQPLECSFVVWPQGTPVAAENLPEGLSLDPTPPRIHGAPRRAGDSQVTLTASGPGGRTHARLMLRIQAVATTAPAAPAPLEPCPVDRFTLRRPDGRRLHVFAGPAIRLGRAVNSDLCLAVCVQGDPGATKALTGEISRHHAEVFIEEGEARVCDGWRSGGVCSTFGTYLDGDRVPPAPGASLRSGQILRLTAHATGATVPHWQVRVLTADEDKAAPSPLREAGRGGIAGVWLQRVDALPDDVLLLAGACDLATLGICPKTVWLGRHGDGFVLLTEAGEPQPLETLAQAIPGSTLEAHGTVCPHDLREALEQSSKK